MRDDDDEQTTSEDRATQLLTCETLSLAINTSYPPLLREQNLPPPPFPGPGTTTTTTTTTITPPPGPVKVLVRKEVGNPADYFDKTFAEYKEGFSANGLF